MSTAEEAQRRLEGAIEARLEGLVVKDMASKYHFNARKCGGPGVSDRVPGLEVAPGSERRSSMLMYSRQ